MILPHEAHTLQQNPNPLVFHDLWGKYTLHFYLLKQQIKNSILWYMTTILDLNSNFPEVFLEHGYACSFDELWFACFSDSGTVVMQRRGNTGSKISTSGPLPKSWMISVPVEEWITQSNIRLDSLKGWESALIRRSPQSCGFKQNLGNTRR